eukprot:5240418-Pyramimonas_sp.AAC.1
MQAGDAANRAKHVGHSGDCSATSCLGPPRTPRRRSSPCASSSSPAARTNQVRGGGIFRRCTDQSSEGRGHGAPTRPPPPPPVSGEGFTAPPFCQVPSSDWLGRYTPARCGAADRLDFWGGGASEGLGRGCLTSTEGVVWSSEDADRAWTPTTDRESSRTVRRGGTGFVE